jgi:hypothetical protein
LTCAAGNQLPLVAINLPRWSGRARGGTGRPGSRTGHVRLGGAGRQQIAAAWASYIEKYPSSRYFSAFALIEGENPFADIEAMMREHAQGFQAVLEVATAASPLPQHRTSPTNSQLRVKRTSTP